MIRVSDEMVTVNGRIRENLREMLAMETTVIRRSYDVDTGRSEPHWGVFNIDCAGCLVVGSGVIDRWVRRKFVELDYSGRVDWSDKSTEWAIINRCNHCCCVGFPLDAETWLCNECLASSGGNQIELFSSDKKVSAIVRITPKTAIATVNFAKRSQCKTFRSRLVSNKHSALEWVRQCFSAYESEGRNLICNTTE